MVDWISVEDALPPVGRAVLCTDGRFVFEAAMVENGRFIRRGVFVFFTTVTHWRKMPEPPKDVLRGAEKIPAEDVAKVVRCKDCRYNDGSRKCLYPDSIIAVPDDDDFCSYGKKREEENDGDV